MTAQEQFQQKQLEVLEELKQFQENLKCLAEKANKNPELWGYAGSMSYVVSQLRDINEFLS